jgi:predicted  nucleic acid-binding Zn-ribbon protein
MVSFETFRAEIAADLDAARVTLTANLEALATAEAAVSVAKRERRELSEAIGRIGPHPTLASAVAWRVRERDSELIQVDAQIVRARNDVKTSRGTIRDLQDALQQIETMMPAAAAATDETLIEVLV